MAWRAASDHDAPPARSRAIANAFLPPDLTERWTAIRDGDRLLSGVCAIEVATPAEEAQAIAIALRQALETPGRTAALVTPDRALGERVASLARRWGIEVDDSAGRALSVTPAGTLLLALAEAAATRFAPLALLALLKHPLVRTGEARLAWLEGTRLLDRALRGPRPAPGLAGIDLHLADRSGRDRELRLRAAGWWQEARALLTEWEALSQMPEVAPARLLAGVREAATLLAGDAVWAGPAGRAAATLLADLEAEAGRGPPRIELGEMPALLRLLMDEVAVRPPQGGHPRLAILGLIEARLATADLMIAGGLNEGSWPGLPAPDPWLAPRIRAELGLPALERRIGIAAHDLAQLLGAPEVLLTRARRDAAAPVVASRFWLRLEALSGGIRRDEQLIGWARALDRHAGAPLPSPRPAPCPPTAARPRQIAVTEVDRLKADPFAFYARRMLRLSALDPVDAEPSAAWRGTAVHAVLEGWFREDGCAPDTLRERALAMLAGEGTHPLLRALWQPRLIEAIDWVATTLAGQVRDGRNVLAVERRGKVEIGGVELSGTFDRVDRLADGGLAIIDYKTGKPPSAKAVRDGFSLQLGLLGLIAERGGFADIDGEARCFEYWSLGRGRDGFGYIASPCDDAGKNGRIVTDEFTATAAANFIDAAARWLTGDEPFVAKLQPEYAPYAEYDQLMRRDEWYGRERG